jgi:hypothetical protein
MVPQNKVFFFEYDFTTPSITNMCIVHMLGVVGVW